ncbi:MAG: hypothetical protein V3T83_15380 [Acidobacteriota bacterium]
MTSQSLSVPARMVTWLWAALFAAGCFTAAPLPVKQQLDDAHFEELSLRLSEEPGSFDTDNLISNETSYQHALSAIRPGSGAGRAYLGVGPGQNFTYISYLKPRLAFIVDIRRDNQLFHLYWKELFERSANRAEFLSNLLGKPVPKDFQVDPDADALQLVSAFRNLPSDVEFMQQRFDAAWRSLHERFPSLTQSDDRRRMLRLSWPFFLHNLDLRFQSHGRRPRPFYPSYSQLILAQDLNGRRSHYLNREEDYQFLRKMQLENRIIPVVGDFAGGKALRAVGQYLSQQQIPLAAFYLSNVEVYLFQSGVYRRFVSNLRAFPIDGQSLLIRSHFGNFGRHPECRPGHFVTCLLQSAQRFLEEDNHQPYWDYWDLVTRDYMPLQPRD